MLLSSLAGELPCFALLHDQQRAPIIRGTVDAALFGGVYREVAARVYDHLDRFKKPPKDHLPDLFADKLEGINRRESTLYTDVFENIHEAQAGINAEYVMSQLETFVRRQSLRSVAIDLAKELQRDTEESLDKADALIAGAGRTSPDPCLTPGTPVGVTNPESRNVLKTAPQRRSPQASLNWTNGALAPPARSCGCSLGTPRLEQDLGH